MHDLIARLLKRHRPGPGSGPDALASLIVAASEDPEFRKRLVFVLSLPESQRGPLIRTGVAEMRLRGEPPDIQAAFLSLVSDGSARTALALLEEL